MKKIILLFIIFCFNVLFSFSCFAQGGSEDFSGQEFEGFDLVGYGEGGEKSWDLKGDTAKIEGNEVKITNVDANAYGEEDMNVVAEKGVIDKESGRMRLEKDVVITTETGAKMLTDSLDWEREKDLIATEDEVVLIRDNMKATGQGMTAQPGLKTAQLNENVKVEYDRTFEDPLAGMITITCDGPMEVDYKGQTAVFRENVVAIDKDRKLIADKMTLYFDAEKKQMKEVVCEGNVLIVQGENSSFSDKAIYKAQEQKILLSGRPKLLMYVNEEKR